MRFVIWTTAIVGVLFMLFVVQKNSSAHAPVWLQTSKNIPKAEAPIGYPERLAIPSLGIDAPIEYVGITPEGAMGAPKDALSVAWFDLGVRPGEIGSAVIDGHYGWKNGRAAVFDTLSTLTIGDKILVKDKQGSTTSFVVRAMKSYAQDDPASEIFSSQDGKAHLNLITCEGVWDKNLKKYSGRLVIFADKE